MLGYLPFLFFFFLEELDVSGCGFSTGFFSYLVDEVSGSVTVSAIRGLNNIDNINSI